ncbi:MAG: hypothetical protein ACYC0L_00345 [Thermoleophilia bacterium]
MAENFSKPDNWIKALYTNDPLMTALLFLLTLLSRIPFRTSMLYAWDSILYARALDHFDVTMYHPQPPGHIFYVALIWTVNRLVNDPNAAMVWVSVFSSAAAVAAMFWLGRTMFSRRVGLWAALLLATSLSFWTHSEVALPYTLLGLLSVVVAGIVYKTWQGKKEYVIPAALVLGLASGFRQDLLPFLLPLFVVGLTGMPKIRISKAVLVLVAAVLSWYVPSALLSGGFDSFGEASSFQSSFLINHSSVFGNDGLGALTANLNSLARFFFWAASSALPLIVVFALILPFRWNRFSDKRLLFLAVWAFPSIAFYIFIHVGELGYIFSFLPAFLLAAAWGTDEVASHIGTGRGDRRVGLLFCCLPALLIVLNLVMFLFFSPKLSAISLAARDTALSSTIDTIKENFDPASTLIIAVHDDQHVSYYLPEYQRLGLDAMAKANTRAQLSSEIEQVVIFDRYFTPAADDQAASLMLGGGQKLNYIPRNSGQYYVYIDWNSMAVSLAK